MKYDKCNAPIGYGEVFGTEPQYKYSKTVKAIRKIKKGIKCPEFDDMCNKPILPDGTIGTLCKDNPELAFYTGFEMAVLQCGEILAKAQNDDK